MDSWSNNIDYSIAICAYINEERSVKFILQMNLEKKLPRNQLDATRSFHHKIINHVIEWIANADDKMEILP